VRVLVRDGVDVAVLVAVCEGDAVTVDVPVAVGLWVAVALVDGVGEGVGVADLVAVGEGVRDGVAVAVVVAGARSARAKSPNDELYPQSVPWSSDKLSSVKLERADQVDPLLFSRARRWGSEYVAVSNTTQMILLPD
jgi:hypothetical protein